MVPPRARRRHQRHPIREVARMYLCWCFLVCLPLVLGENQRQIKVTYHREEKKLRVECPEEALPDDMLAASLKRVGPGDETRLADWMPNREEPNFSRSLHSRITVDTSQTKRLVAELHDVTCRDSAAYVCTNFGLNGVKKQYNQSFEYLGDVSMPHITKEPLKARYDVGEVLELTCSASPGARELGMVWEIRRPQDQDFTPLDHTDFPHYLVSPEDIQESGCRINNSLRLEYHLKANDDGTFFQCRLKRTGQVSQTTVALRCPRDSHVTPTSDGGGASSASSDEDLGGSGGKGDYAIGGTFSARAAKLQSGEGDDEGDRSQSQDPTLVVVVVVAVAVLVLVLVGAALVVRRWRKKMTSPLVVAVDTPASSEYGHSDQLPNLPNLTMLDHDRLRTHHFTHQPPTSLVGTFPRSLSTSRYVGSPLLASHQPSDAEDPNVSVYVSMTGLDSAGLSNGQPLKGLKGKDTGAPRSFADGFEGWSDSFGSEVREDPNASAYSNQTLDLPVRGALNANTNKGNSPGKANAVDDEVTRLKIVD